MPYKSDAQRRFMHARHPDIAAQWDKEYPNQKGLPEHVKKAVQRRLKKRARVRSKGARQT